MDSYAIINSCDWGSTGKIALNLLRSLKNRDLNVFFCYGHGAKSISVSLYRVDNICDRIFHALFFRLTGRIGCASILATKRLLRFLSKNGVNHLFLINLHGNYLNEKLFFQYIIREGIKVVYIMVDESAFLGNCYYRNGCQRYLYGCSHCKRTKWFQYILGGDPSRKGYAEKFSYYSQMDIDFVAPEYVIKVAQKSPLLLGKRLSILDEAVDTSLNYPRVADRLLFELGIDPDKIIIVCIAPYPDERKGVGYFIEAARILECNPNFSFVQVGYNLSYKDNLPSNYIPVSYVNDQNRLCEFYSIADLFVFPSLEDTMPNTCLEALSCGSPLLCFDISGMPFLGDASVLRLVPPGDANALAEEILHTKKKTKETIEICRNYAINRYDSNKYAEMLLSIMQNPLVA